MLTVSDKYMAAVTDNRRTSKVRCVLTLKSGDVVNLYDADIIKDTLYVTNQSTNNSDFEYGCVYSGECGFSFRKNIDRYALYDAKVQPYWSLQLDDGTWEEIPLGVFYVSQSTRVNDKLNIKALDGMTLCDINVADNTTGAPYDLLAFTAKKCGFEVAQTRTEIEKLPNGSLLLALYADRVDTYRDLVAYLGMMTASFATFDRYGKLKLVPYSTRTDVTLDKKQRFMEASFSDYQTSFIGVEARFIANENYAPYEAYVSGTGLILDMGDIPIMQGLPSDKHLALNNILAVLKNVKYTPCEIEIAPNPAIELGDMITNANAGKDGAGYKSLVTYTYWSYRGKHKLKSIGGNPKLNGISSKTYKQLKDMEAIIDTKNMSVASYTNAEPYEFSTTQQEIIRLQYSTLVESTPVFLATVNFNMTLDGYVTFRFYIDSALDESRTITGFYERGNNIATFSDYFEDEAETRKTVMVTAQVSYFASDNRKQQASTISSDNFLKAINDNDTTIKQKAIGKVITTNTLIDLQGHELAALPNGAKDTLAVDAGGHVILTQRVGKIVFSGKYAEYWDYYPGTQPSPVFASSALQSLAKPSTFALSSAYSVSTDPNGYSAGCCAVDRWANLYVGDTRFTDTAAFKEYLAATPLTAYYELATPVTFDLGTITLPTLNTGSNIIYASNTPASVLGVEYMDINEQEQTVSGETITIEDASNAAALGLSADGAYEQDGTPTPAAPVPVEVISGTLDVVSERKNFESVVVFPAYTKGVIDTTVATCSIAEGKVKAAIFAQGISGSGAWDGTLDLSDYMSGALAFGSLGIGTITANVATSLKAPLPGIASDSVGSMTFGALAIGEVLDAIVITPCREFLRFASDEDIANYTYDSNFVDTDGSFKMQSQWHFDAVEGEIEQGRMETVNIITDGIDAEGVVIDG